MLGGDFSTRFDSNVGRASAGRDEEWEISFEPSARAGRTLQVAERTRLTGAATLLGEIHARESELDAVEVGGELVLTHKFGIGQAPWMRVSVDGGYRDVDAGQRSGPRLGVGATAGKRFSPRLSARLDYRYAQRWGDLGPRVATSTLPRDVFDQRFHTIGASGSFLASDRVLLTAGFDYRVGDFDSNAQRNRQSVLARKNVEAVSQDQALGGWVYRVDGAAYSPYARMNVALFDRASLDLGYRFQVAKGGGLQYENHVVQAMVLFRY